MSIFPTVSKHSTGTNVISAEFTAVYEAKREKYETFLDRGVRRKHTLGIAYWILPESLRGEEAPPYMLPPPLAKLQVCLVA